MDAYSLLHAAMGVIAYFWGVPLWLWITLHTLFEVAENTVQGMHWINQHVPVWPGGKPTPDSWLNRVGDISSGVVGWGVAALVARRRISVTAANAP